MLQATVDGQFGIENVHWGEGVAPVPGKGQVLVRMRAASLNFRDLLVATGKYNPKMPLPRVILSDGAGEVAALGSGVTRWRVGDRVAGIFMQTWLAGRIGEESGKSALGGAIDGVLAEEVVVDQNGLVSIPAHLSFEEAATLPCAAVTAWNALVWSGGLRPGETVLVQGSGGVSVFALQFAKMAGARVVAITSTAQKMERLKSLGADWVVNYREDANWGRTIAKAGGVDHVVEVGGTGTLEQSLVAVKGGGRVSVIGILSGITGALNIGPILHKNVTMQGIYVGSREMFEQMNAAIALHQMQPVIDRVYDAPEIQNALRLMEAAGQFGKIVIRVG